MNPDRWRFQLDCLRVPERFLDVEESVPLTGELATWSGSPWCVTILGPAGSGKTWLAIRLIAGVWGKRATDGTAPRLTRPRFADAAMSITAIRRQMGKPDDGDAFDALCAAECLLLDDLGAERETDYSRDQISLVLRSRYNAMKPTIITSNAMTLQELGDSRIASRLSDGIVLTLDRTDRRGTR